MLRNYDSTLWSSLCSLCVVCSCSNSFGSCLWVQQLVGSSFSSLPQLTVFSVCLRTPKTLSQLTPFSVFAPILSLVLSLPPSRPPTPSHSFPFVPFYSHEVCIPHLLCRLHTKEQKAPLLTCGKHSSPLGPAFTQPQSLILPVASARTCLLSNAAAGRCHRHQGQYGSCTCCMVMDITVEIISKMHF